MEVAVPQLDHHLLVKGLCSVNTGLPNTYGATQHVDHIKRPKTYTTKWR